ncbi:MAG: hypothetical protein L3K09_08330, partial [Thermoplasmata archaeon]|nr:hypothetical protein [Thermoplasmata archaeon]
DGSAQRPSGDVGSEEEAPTDWTEAWTLRQVLAGLEWQYGPDAAQAIVAKGVRGVRSARTGRLRRLSLGEDRLFFVDNDGIPRPTWAGARLLREVLPFPVARIVVAPDAEPFVSEGRSLFSRFVRGGDSALIPGSSALLVSEDDRLLAVGRLFLAPPEMGRLSRGVAVRVTAHARAPLPVEPEDAPERADASPAR